MGVQDCKLAVSESSEIINKMEHMCITINTQASVFIVFNMVKQLYTISCFIKKSITK